MEQNQKLQNRIKGRVRIEPSGCWTWLGFVDMRGYGRISYSGANHLVHRIAAHAWNGFDLDPNMPVHHACANRACCNPDHLQTISMRENNAEMLERKYYRRRIEQLEREVRSLRRKVTCLSKNSKEPSTSHGS